MPAYRRGLDGCGDFFLAALESANPAIPDGAHVLEVGCAEFPWLTYAVASWPNMTFSGVDWRPTAITGADITRANALLPDLYQPASFDWIVSISAVEHFGLGHYEADPKDNDGDTRIIANMLRWLKPGGWLYFDVPFSPSGYRVVDTSHRQYDYDAFLQRLWIDGLAQAKASCRWHWTGYVPAGECTRLMLDRPTQDENPFHYIGVWWQKVW